MGDAFIALWGMELLKWNYNFSFQKLRVLKVKVPYQGIKNGPIGKRLLLALYLDMSMNVFYVLYVAEMTKN